VQRAQRYIDSDYWREAAELAGEAAKAAPENSSAAMLQGMAQLKAKDYDGAAQSFARVLEVDPDNAAARGQLAMAYARSKRWDKAAQAISELADKNADSSQGAGVIRGEGPGVQAPSAGSRARTVAEIVNQGDWPALLTAARAALAEDPTSANALLRLGMALYKLGEPERALAAYDKAAKAVKKDSARAVVNFNRSTVLMQLRRWEDACKTLEDLSLLPEPVRGKLSEEAILYNLAYCYRKRKMIRMALATYGQLSDINSSYKDVSLCLKRLRVPLAANLPPAQDESGARTCEGCGRPMPLGATSCDHCRWVPGGEEQPMMDIEI